MSRDPAGIDVSPQVEAILALSATGLWELGTEPRRLAWSATTARLHGCTTTPSVEDFLSSLDASDRSTVLAAAQAACDEPGRPRMFSYRWPVDGAIRHLQVHAVADRAAGGRGSCILGSVRDVTNETLAREALQDATQASASASRVKSQFLANMSHEIRTPMNAVLGMTGLLLDTSLSPEQRAFASAARASGAALLGIINDILDLSKIEAGKLVFEERVFDLREIVGEVLEGLSPKAREKGLVLGSCIDESVSHGNVGDPTRVRQVVTNLLANAVKFTSSGEVLLDASQVGDFLHVAVRDTGVGIPAEALTAIFEPFQQADATMTRRFGGTGLGLSIVKQLVERMGGSINVRSEPGRGSTFEVSMRAGRAAPGALVAAVDMTAALNASAAPARPAAGSGTTRPLHILVAEDDDTNALLARSLLKKLGHTMVRARTGAEAVARSAEQRFDVILMDVQMPELDGFEATAKIREREATIGGHIPIVALTANAMKGDDELCLARGMDEYISKPVSAAGLQAALGRVR